MMRVGPGSGVYCERAGGNFPVTESGCNRRMWAISSITPEPSPMSRPPVRPPRFRDCVSVYSETEVEQLSGRVECSGG